jgi:hypothetical protein
MLLRNEIEISFQGNSHGSAINGDLKAGKRAWCKRNFEVTQRS